MNTSLGLMDLAKVEKGVLAFDSSFFKNKRVLIVAPHPDDESLMSSGIIKHVLDTSKLRDKLRIVVLTRGDLFGRKRGEQRIMEFWNAMKELGVNKASVVLLNYKDLSLMSYFKGKRKKKFGIKLLSDLKDLLSDFKPSVVFTTSFLDEHPDHRITYYVMRFLIQELSKTNPINPVLFSTIIHSPTELCFLKDSNKYSIKGLRSVVKTLMSDLSWPGFDFNPRKDFKNPFLLLKNKPYYARLLMLWNLRSVFLVPESMLIKDKFNNLKFRVLSNYRPAIVPRSKLTDRTRYLYQGYVRNNEFFFDESSCNKLFGFEINFLIEHFFKRFIKDIN